MPYIANSIEDLAKLIDQRASNEEKLSKDEKNVLHRNRQFAKGAGYAYRECARLLRETTIKKE